ncbi:alpha/beta hydrolase [Gordonia sp. Z-3]|jgi:pimeloyl-ACP methyl ester carboxylesterase|uniref:alpha/beta fold hydrolase n=1 Tax=Gordonia sp. Z-3 TaxID=3115408 RepID=UPI002E2ABCB1|nr:alpha/beta hydrolase [Gordonia sp. Z-3]MED5800579.1 alpha/beta hydrolase [Gordonia sp. Z-3]
MTTTSTITLPSGTVEYASYGPDKSAHPPIVFMHGVAVDHRLWQPVAEILAARGYRSYAPTMPLGSHHIPWGPSADRSPRGAARLLREFVDRLGLADATLVANDTGGAITQYALDADPHFVRALVFTNCDAFDLFPPQPFQLVFALLRQRLLLTPLIETMRWRALRHSSLGVGLLVTDPDPDLTRSVFEPLRTDARIRDDLIAFLHEIDPADLAAVTPRMSRVQVPVAMVWGTGDRCFTPEHGRRFADVFGDAQFIEVPHARTFVSLDQPQAVADGVVAASARSDR